MKTPRVHALLLCLLTTITLVHSQGLCISESEVGGIAQRWLNAFATGGLPTLSSAVTENVRKPIPHLHPTIHPAKKDQSLDPHLRRRRSKRLHHPLHPELHSTLPLHQLIRLWRRRRHKCYL